MTTTDFGIGFWGREDFGNGHDFHEMRKEMKKEFRAQWNKMSDSEKIAFINMKIEKMDEMEKRIAEFHNQDRLSVENMDKRCLEWIKKTPEEKKEFINQRRKMHQNFHF